MNLSEFKKVNIPEHPSMLDYIHQKMAGDYNRMIEEKIMNRCIDFQYLPIPERIVLIIGPNKESLYYYRDDMGALMPLIAFSFMDVSYTAPSGISNATIKLSCDELHPDIFKHLNLKDV